MSLAKALASVTEPNKEGVVFQDEQMQRDAEYYCEMLWRFLATIDAIRVVAETRYLPKMQEIQDMIEKGTVEATRRFLQEADRAYRKEK